jgi:indoleacetamide hydrolase
LFDSVIANDWRPLQPTPLRGVRLGVVRDYWYRDLDSELERITSAALARLLQPGAELVESEFPQLMTLHESITTPVITH